MRNRREMVPSERGFFDQLMAPSVFRNLPSFFHEGMLRQMPDFFRDESMNVEEFREGEDLVVRADLPGIDPDNDVEITIADGLLQIQAERRHNEEEAGRDYYRSEVRYGAFARSLPLPRGATAEDVKASYNDGVLEVRVHAPEVKETTTTVPVSRGK